MPKAAGRRFWARAASAPVGADGGLVAVTAPQSAGI